MTEDTKQGVTAPASPDLPAATRPIGFDELLCEAYRAAAGSAREMNRINYAALPNYTVETHPDPTSVPWPDAIGCPYRPWGRRGRWYVFEERFPPIGYGAKQVYLSEHQITFGEIAAPLNLREDWLAESFPDHGADFGCWDIQGVAAWLRHHIAVAPDRRRDHAASKARGQTPPHAIAPPVQPQEPPPPREAPTTWSMLFDPSSATHAVAAIRTAWVTRDDKGRRHVVLTISLPGMRDLVSVGVKLPETAARELADVLCGTVRAR